MRETTKLYVIASNRHTGLYWNHGLSAGQWAIVGSYYLTREEAERTINSGLDGHIEAEEIKRRTQNGRLGIF